MSEQINKVHRKTKEKKQRPAGSENPKAHSFANPGRLQRQTARSHDIREKKLHVPLVDRLPEEAPPLVVGVVGPPQVGKTTLIKSLIRRYTKQTLSAPTGPLTVVTSKRRRLTFLECPAESLAAMIDVAKVVDIVLLMIDGKYGFEMETMEFLNVLSASGMPGNVFGILTHLDLFKKQDTLRTQKKRLKHRFWSELYQGAKLFYLSGVVNGRYPDREVLNLSRFLSVMKNPRPLVWRNSHPYALADRFLDITPPTDVEANPKCDRTVALYGYLRGTNFSAQGAQVHVPGLGDLQVSDVEALPDPCPTPHQKQAFEKVTGKTGRKRLGEKERVLFAPMSDVGGVLVDKDAVYIDVKSNTFDRDADGEQERGFGEQMMMGLQGDRQMLGRRDEGVRLFGNGSTMRGVSGYEEEDEYVEPAPKRRRALGPTDRPTRNGRRGTDAEQNDIGISEDEGLDGLDADGGTRLHHEAVVPGDSGDEEDSAEDLDEDALSDSEAGSAALDPDHDASATDYEDLSDDEPTLRWKQDLSKKAQALHGRQIHGRTTDLARLMYDESISVPEALRKWRGEDASLQTNGTLNGEIEDDELFRQKQAKSSRDGGDEDRMMPYYDYSVLEQKWEDPDNLEALRQRFALTTFGTGANAADVGEGEGLNDEDAEGLSEDEEGDGDFEDLEADDEEQSRQNADNPEATTLEGERAKNARRKEELKSRFEEEDREGFANDKSNARKETAVGDDFGEDDWYEAQKSKIQKQLDINRAEFADMDDHTRAHVEGYRAGTYARLVLSAVPYEFVAHFNPRTPLIIGGLNPTETRFGMLQCRIKRHRWHPKILKSNDPLIFSLGWRRFQSLPVYTTSDSRTRNRMLKYTPEHMHCFGSFYGPLIAPNTGFCAVQSLSSSTPGFRIAATGVITSVDSSVEIVKKLKLKGHPAKVYKNTAILRDLFSSELEAAKFKAANLRTVSGIRGMVKGRAGGQYPDGYVRAGFEDKILMSDIVFLNTWTFVKVREFYAPVTNLLIPPRQRPTVAATKALPSSSSSPEDDSYTTGTQTQLSTTNGTTPATNTAAHNDQDQDPTWTGMRLTSAIRAQSHLPIPSNPTSHYTPMARQERHFNPLRIPRSLLSNLPFKSQPSTMKPSQKQAYVNRRAVVLGGEEKKARDLMQKVLTVRNEKVAKRREAQEARRVPYRRKVAEGEEKRREREKRESREFWRREGKKRGRGEDGEGGGGGGKRRKT